MSNYKSLLSQAAADMDAVNQNEDIDRDVDYGGDEDLTPIQKIRQAVNTTGNTEGPTAGQYAQVFDEAAGQNEAVYGQDFESIKSYLGDQNLNYDTQDLEDMRAWEVSGAEKGAKFVGRALGKAFTATGEGIGVMGGLAKETMEAAAGTMGLAEGEEGEFNMNGFVNNAFVKYYQRREDFLSSIILSEMKLYSNFIKQWCEKCCLNKDLI